MKPRRRIENGRGGSPVNRLGVFGALEQRRLLFFALWAVLATVLFGWVLAVPALSQEPPAVDPPPAPAPGDSIIILHEVDRDSLVVEIGKYSQMISAMRDSLSLAELGLGIELGPEDRVKLENSIQDFTQLIEEIGSELGQMDLEIAGNQVSLLDAQGEGIVINIPENLDEQLSQGLNVLSKMILSELPDSVQFDTGGDWGWHGVELKPFGRKEKRKVLKGNIVKVWDRLQVSKNEDVRGHVVVVFGDAEVSGRVDGNVVAVFGDLQLTDRAEVTGKVVAVGGRLDQDPDADVNDVVVVDPWRRLGGDGPEGMFNPGPMAFILGQGEFLAMLLFSVLAFSLAPKRRLESAVGMLQARPLPSFAGGLLASLLLHLIAVLVMAILVLTIIGIPVALLLGVALVGLGVMSVGLTSLVVGGAICRRITGQCGSTWLAVVLGLLAIHLVSFVGQTLGIWPDLAFISRILTGLGAIIKIGAYFFGLGALVFSRFGTARASSGYSADNDPSAMNPS